MEPLNPASFIRRNGPLAAKVEARRRELIASGRLRDDSSPPPAPEFPAHPRKKPLHKGHSAWKIANAVAEVYLVTVDDLLSDEKCRRIAWPRMVAYAVTKRVTGMSNNRIASAFGCVVSWVCKAVHTVRERVGENRHLRDDFNAAVVAARAAIGARRGDDA